MQKWTPYYFKQHFGQHQVQVSYTKRMAFANFAGAVPASSEQHPGPYLYRLFFHEHLPELLPDLIPQNVYGFPLRHVSPLMPERWRRSDGFLKLLMGGPGSKFPVTHYDLEHAHAQITGQMIFIPMGWWRAARPLSVSISVCTAIMDRSNWPGFVRDVCATPEGRPIKRLLKRGHLIWTGERRRRDARDGEPANDSSRPGPRPCLSGQARTHLRRSQPRAFGTAVEHPHSHGLRPQEAASRPLARRCAPAPTGWGSLVSDASETCHHNVM
uniref:Putative Clavaminate synthase n=1 Tax=mine drainage metagenome TaxID=410659 RepID=E6PQY6_9ZZZZ